MSISIIVAVDLDGGIGKENQLLCHLPKDLKYFKQTTTGKTIVMGHNTFLSIGKPLPNRKNVVLSRREHPPIAGITFYKSLTECLTQEQSENKELMIIGGGRLYKEAIALSDKIYLTRIHHRFEADTFFPELGENWLLEKDEFSEKDLKNPYNLSFQVYGKKF